MKRRFILSCSLALVASLGLTGCGSNASAEADGSKTLNIYAWAGEIPDSIVKDFAAETGIKVTVDTFDSNETMIAKLQAGNSGYDVVEASQYAVGLLADRKLIAEIDQTRVEGLENLADKFADPSYDPGNRHSIPWAWGTTGILYNEKCTNSPVTGWADMWNEAYKGKVYMLDNMLSAYIAGLQIDGLSATSTDEADIAKATDRLLAQKPMLAGYNSTNYADLIAVGDACIAQSYSGTVAAKAVENNEDVHYILPKEGGTLWTDSFSVVTGTKSEDAAYAWLNYTLKPEIAARLTDEASLATPNQAAQKLVKDQSLVSNSAIYAPEEDLEHAEFIVDPGAALSFYQSGWTRVRAS